LRKGTKSPCASLTPVQRKFPKLFSQ
jgi:hypothetical protein